MALKINARKTNIPVAYKDEKTQELLATFYVTPLTAEEFKKIVDANQDVEWDAPNKNAKLERFKEPNFLGILYDRIDKIIVGWEGIYGPDDKPAECTKENKIALYLDSPGVVNWVLAQASKLSEAQAEQEDKETKN